MSELREVLLASLAGLLAVVCALSAWLFFSPSFTDYEIQQSFVDTWEVNALLTAVGLSIAVPSGLAAVLLGIRGSQLAKRLALSAIGLCAISCALLITNHALLTARTTRLTGQEFGGMFGLGLW